VLFHKLNCVINALPLHKELVSGKTVMYNLMDRIVKNKELKVRSFLVAKRKSFFLKKILILQESLHQIDN